MRFIIGVLITLGLIILVLVMLFRGGGSPAQKPLTLSDYAHTNSVAKLIIDGPVIAESKHQSVEIDVSNSNVNFTLYQGYQQDAIKSQSYSNNDDAYLNFLKSLQFEGFTKGNKSADLRDQRGVCPLGTRYLYQFVDDNNDERVHLWNTSCGGGTFKGKSSSVIALFKQQVPDYGDLVADTNLSSTSL